MQPFLPISVELLHDATLDDLIVEGVMTRDFGPWKKDEHHILTFNFDAGTVAEYGESGDLIKKIQISLSAWASDEE